MADDTPSKTQCCVCKSQFNVMKRCTKCRSVFYCTRDCQMKDWPHHKLQCSNIPSTAAVRKDPPTYSFNDDSIFNDSDKEEEPVNGDQKIHPPLVDFSRAMKKSKQSPQESDAFTADKDTKTYMHYNEIKTDIPVLDNSQSMVNIIVRCNKEKHKVCIQNSWSGEQTFKYLSHVCKVPLEKLKLIHKGRVLTTDSVTATLAAKALYQVVGEQALDESGLDQRDICVLMKQAGIDRNKAVQSLRKKGDLIDVLLGQ